MKKKSDYLLYSRCAIVTKVCRHLCAAQCCATEVAARCIVSVSSIVSNDLLPELPPGTYVL